MDYRWVFFPFLFSVYFSPISYCRGTSETNNKPKQARILLNDPTLLNSKIEALERELQSVKSKLLEQETELQSVKTNLLEQETKTQDLQHKLDIKDTQGPGTTFIRWGRKTCPGVNGTSLLYNGFAGGRNYNAHGSGTTTLCLPHNPDPSKFHTSSVYSYYHGVIYGSEYQFNFKNIATDDDVPCAVCYSYQGTSVMIPAKTSCPSQWTKQFAGFLTSGFAAIDRLGAEYLCMDEDPEYMTDGARQNNYDGRLFYPVHTVCGSLPCPPYHNDTTVACVVCSK